MSRLFVSGKEIDYANDIRKEIYKDVGMHKVYYYAISYDKTKFSEIDGESDEKTFETPVILDALAKFTKPEVVTNNFGVDYKNKLEFYVSFQDMIDKGIDIKPGDFCEYGNYFYEVTKVTPTNYMYGMVEYFADLLVEGVQARDLVFKTNIKGPRAPLNSKDSGQPQFTAEQQRGFSTDSEGNPTGDFRELERNGTMEPAIEGQQKSGKGSEFYLEKPPKSPKQFNDPTDEW